MSSPPAPARRYTQFGAVYRCSSITYRKAGRGMESFRENAKRCPSMVVEPTPSNCEQKSWTWQRNWKISAALNFSCDGQATDQTTTAVRAFLVRVSHQKHAREIRRRHHRCSG